MDTFTTAGRGAQFAALLKITLEAIDAATVDDETRYAIATPADREALANRARLLNYNVRLLHEAAPWIANAVKPPSLALGVSYFVDEIARDLIKRPADVVVVPQPEYMYSVFPRPFDALSANLRIAYPPGPPPIVLYCPERELRTVLLHPLFAHELAHSAVAEHDLVSEAQLAHPDQAALQALLDAATIALATQTSMKRSDATLSITSLFDKWVEEILCDALALEYLGPTYLFSFVSVVYLFSSNTPGEWHPPTSLRLSFMIESLMRNDWFDLISSEFPQITSWLKMIAKDAPHVDISYPSEFYDVIDALLDPIRQVASNHLRDEAVMRARAEGKIREVERLLAARILPVQLDDQTAIDRRVALLGAWFYELRTHGDEPARLHTVLQDANRQAFFAKGLEMSIVLERWQEL